MYEAYIDLRQWVENVEIIVDNKLPSMMYGVIEIMKLKRVKSKLPHGFLYCT